MLLEIYKLESACHFDESRYLNTMFFLIFVRAPYIRTSICKKLPLQYFVM